MFVCLFVCLLLLLLLFFSILYTGSATHLTISRCPNLVCKCRQRQIILRKWYRRLQKQNNQYNMSTINNKNLSFQANFALRRSVCPKFCREFRSAAKYF